MIMFFRFVWMMLTSWKSISSRVFLPSGAACSRVRFMGPVCVLDDMYDEGDEGDATNARRHKNVEALFTAFEKR